MVVAVAVGEKNNTSCFPLFFTFLLVNWRHAAVTVLYLAALQ